MTAEEIRNWYRGLHTAAQAIADQEAAKLIFTDQDEDGVNDHTFLGDLRAMIVKNTMDRWVKRGE